MACAQGRPEAPNVSISLSRGSVHDFRCGRRSCRGPSARYRSVIAVTTENSVLGQGAQPSARQGGCEVASWVGSV